MCIYVKYNKKEKLWICKVYNLLEGRKERKRIRKGERE